MNRTGWLLPTIALILTSSQAAPAADLPPAFAAPAPGKVSSVDQPVPLSEDDFVLLETSIAGILLSDGMGAYASRAGIYLPLGEMARLLEFSIIVEPLEQRAIGSTLSSEHPFELDLASRTARVGTASIVFDRAEVVVKDHEIYVLTDLMSRLLPATFKPDIRNLSLAIVPRETLPFQQRVERKLRHQGIGADHTEVSSAMLDTPYQFYSPPAVDLQLDGAVANAAAKSRFRYDLRLAGDLLFSGAQFYAASNDASGLDDIRLLFERKDPEGKTAGPLGITRATAGDTFTPGLPFGAQSVNGRGVTFTNEPLEQASIFGRADFRGELQAGYEVEIYVNEVLRGSQAEPVEGRYDFSAVPLIYGINNVRLIFYGPRGERREEVHRLNVGGGQIEPGQTRFALGVVEQGRPLFAVGRGDGFDPGFGKLQITARVAHGLTPATTLVAGFARYNPVLRSARNMATVGLRTSVFSIASQLDFAADNKAGLALGGGIAGNAGPLSYLFRHNEYQGGFVDEALPGAGGAVILRRSTNGRLDTIVPLGNRSIPLAAEFRRDEEVGGRTTIRSDARLSAPIGGYLASSFISLQRTSGPGTNRTIVRGSTDLSGIIPLKWQLRGSLMYDVAPGTRVTDAFLTADRALTDRSALRLGASRHFGRSPTTTLLAGATLRLPFADVSLNAGYTSIPFDLRFGIQLALGAAFNPLADRYQLTRPGVTSGGIIAVSTRIERSGAEPAPVPGVVISGSGLPARTDNRGITLVTGLGNGSLARIQADIETVDDPYLTVDEYRFAIVPRPGRSAVAIMKFAVSGEVLLKLMYDDGRGNLRGLSALRMQLVAPDGTVAAEGRTEYDGSLVLEGLHPGAYEMRIEPDQAKRLSLYLAHPPPVTINPAGGFSGEISVVVKSN